MGLIMLNNNKAHIFIVDDDSCILSAISASLKNLKFKCICFENADDCLKQLHQQNCDLLITDVQMPGKDGLELLVEAKHIVPWLPVLVMTGYGDIPLAVKAVKAGAVDFIEKPIEWDSFISLVQSVIEQNKPSSSLRGKTLTKTESIILHLILQSKSNKEIAQILHRSIRTVEVHRSNIMKKFNVDSIVELVKRATSMDLDFMKFQKKP